jgi:hypothetical protein
MQNFSFPPWDSPLAAPVETLFQQLPPWYVPPGEDPLQSAKTNTATVGRIMNELRGLVETYHFENSDEEIAFFKKIKPLFSCSLIYWNRFSG